MKEIEISKLKKLLVLDIVPYFWRNWYSDSYVEVCMYVWKLFLEVDEPIVIDRLKVQNKSLNMQTDWKLRRMLKWHTQTKIVNATFVPTQWALLRPSKPNATVQKISV